MFNSLKKFIVTKRAISCLASMSVLFAQLPQIQVRAEASSFTDQATGINFSVENNVYTVANEQTVADGSKYVGIYTLSNNTFAASKVDDSISGEKIILGSIDGKDVTSIGGGAFYFCRNLTSVRLPEGLLSIGSQAFDGCENLASINFPEGLLSIGDQAFSGCSCITSLTLPDSLTTVGSHAFSYTAITSARIPNSVTVLGYSAFYGCNSLTEVTLSTGLTSIGGSVFVGCYSLTSIIIPASVESIGSLVFSDCTSLREITIMSGTTTVGSGAFQMCPMLGTINVACNFDTTQITDNSGGWLVQDPNDNDKFITYEVAENPFYVSGQNSQYIQGDGHTGTFNRIHQTGGTWSKDTSGEQTRYIYDCPACEFDVEGSITIDGVTDELEMGKNSEGLLVAVKSPEYLMSLTWTSEDPEKATLTAQGTADNKYILRTGDSLGEVTITVAGTAENSPEKTFTLKIKNAGVISDEGYPRVFYVGQTVKDPLDFFGKNPGNSAILGCEWHAGADAAGDAIATPNNSGIYSLKVTLPSSAEYTSAECTVPVKIMKLPVHVADGEQGVLSMQVNQLNVQRWEKAGSKDAETFTEISGSNSASYTPGDEDYGKYIRVVTEDGDGHEVVSEPVLVKFLKNLISFSHN